MNEKMTILNMLQNGKITADEASRLLSSIEEKGSRPAPDRTATPTADSGAMSNDGRHEASGSRPASGSGVDFDELGRKFAAFAKDLEPKIQKATEIVAEKTVSIADKISDTISKTIEFDSSSAHRSSPLAGTERHIELPVEGGYNELDLAGLNGEVNIKGYNGDKISADIRFKAKRGKAAIDLMKLGGKYYLNYEEDNFEFVSIDAYVPADKFKMVNISDINGNIDISGLNCEQLKISSANGQAALSGLAANVIKAESGNGRLTLSDITANEAIFEHFNGAVEAWGLDVEKLALTNFNGGVAVSVAAFIRFSDYLWNLETSNAKLTLNVPTLPDLGYHIRADAALGDIKIGLSGLDFMTNTPSSAEARSTGFDTRRKKVKLALETSNESLTVN